ncbi:MAG TPA: 4-hydroxy-tetrahydrodipicolinate synthase [bacterium]
MYKGSYVAIATPFKNNRVDQTGLRRNIAFLRENGSAGIVACATTGEGPCLSKSEYELIIRTCVEEVKGKIPVIAGAGTNSTAKTIAMVHHAQNCSADGLLIVTPYYNRPTQEGLYQHYKTINADTDLPIMIYNVPSRTGTNILPLTVARLVRDCKRIRSIKEASGNLEQVSELLRLGGKRLDVLSGDDSLTLPMLMIGALGVVSVVANILPRAVADMCRSFFSGKIRGAQRIHLRLFPVVKALFLETNPIPLKKAMHLMGMPSGKLRLPLVEMSSANTVLLRSALKGYGVKI